MKINCPRRKRKDAQVAFIPKTSKGGARLDQWESLIEVRVDGKQAQALVDTGSSQTIVRADLVAKRNTLANGEVLIRCVHGDEVSYPTAEVYLEVEKVSYLITVAVAEKLPYPVVLGKDIPGLATLVDQEQSCNMAVTRSQTKTQDGDRSWDMLPFGDLKRKTRSQKRSEKFKGTKRVETDPHPELDSALDKAIPADIVKAQRADVSLEPFYTDLAEDEHGDATGPKFKLKEYCIVRGRRESSWLYQVLSEP